MEINKLTTTFIAALAITSKGNAQNIFQSARSGDLDSVKQWLENGKKIDTLNSDGYSLLQLAIYHGNQEMAKLLIEAGANIEIRDKAGNTPLISAAFKGDYVTLKLLIERGAKINAVNYKGITGLLYATVFEHNTVIEMLLTYGAKDLEDNLGRTCQNYIKETGNQRLAYTFAYTKPNINVMIHGI